VLIRRIATIAATVVLGGFLGATLVRLAPGFGVDEQELDSRLRNESIQALRQSHARERNIASYYYRYLQGIFRGDLGYSHSLQRPIAELFAQRIPLTFRSVGMGLLGGWLAALALALPAGTYRLWDLFSTFLSGLLLCLPSAVIALLFLFVGGSVSWAIALVVFPKVFRYTRNLLVETRAMPHVLMARAKGLGPVRILFWHVLPPALPQILALAGVSVSMAFGAAIPIEVICDSPGIGQLAWQAAVARDLPLLVNLTVLITVITLTANAISDLGVAAATPQLAVPTRA